MVKGTSPDGRHYFPAFPVHVLSADRHRRPARSVRVSEDAAGGAGQVEAARRAVSVQHPPHARRLEIPVPRRQAVQADPRKDAAWNRGAYLVNGPGHCAECHSPRNILGGIVASQRFAGGPDAGWRRLRAEHHAEGLEHVARADSSSCSRPARRRTATPSAARWARSSATPASSAPRIAPRSRLTSSRCRRSRGRSHRNRNSLLIAMPRESGASCFWATR